MTYQPPMIDTLKNNLQFSYVKKQGTAISTKGILLVACKSDISRDEHAAHIIQVGYTVTKKVGNAVARNRIKRRFREVVQDVLPSLGLEGYSYVLIAKHHAHDRPYESLKKDLCYALHSFNKDISSHA